MKLLDTEKIRAGQECARLLEAMDFPRDRFGDPYCPWCSEFFLTGKHGDDCRHKRAIEAARECGLI